MKLYRIWQEVNNDYDTYSDAFVRRFMQVKKGNQVMSFWHIKETTKSEPDACCCQLDDETSSSSSEYQVVELQNALQELRLEHDDLTEKFEMLLDYLKLDLVDVPEHFELRPRKGTAK